MGESQTMKAGSLKSEAWGEVYDVRDDQVTLGIFLKVTFALCLARPQITLDIFLFIAILQCRLAKSYHAK